MDAITQTMVGDRPIRAHLDPFNPTGSTANVHFTSSKTNIWTTDAAKAHLNIHVLDSNWEGEFCRVAEAHPNVLAYVKNHNMGFEVPYRFKSERRTYIPDFIVLLDDGRGKDDPLHLVVEVKGYRGEDAKDKKATMETYWVPGVNNLGTHGRWAFAECTQVHDFSAMIDEHGSGDGGGR
jgi:type III restriction enzyme